MSGASFHNSNYWKNLLKRFGGGESNYFKRFARSKVYQNIDLKFASRLIQEILLLYIFIPKF
jgi:hypothetical protein